MGKARSLRGEEVDFDLLKIKNSIADVAITDDVKKRERFVNAKKRRSSKRKVNEMVHRASVDEQYKENIQNLKVDEEIDTDNTSEVKKRKVKHNDSTSN